MKMHGKWDQFMNGTTNKCERQHLLDSNNTCKYKANVDDIFSAIVLIRNPWNAFFSEYQRTRNLSINGHIHNLLRHEFDTNTFKKVIDGYVYQYIETFKIYETFKQLNRDVLLIKFENIENEIWDILKFLFTDKYLMENYLIFKQRISCIFNNNSMLPRISSIKRPTIKDWLNSSLYLTKEQVYLQMDEVYLCKIWNKMSDYIIKYDLLQYGYNDVVQNLNCYNIQNNISNFT